MARLRSSACWALLLLLPLCRAAEEAEPKPGLLELTDVSFKPTLQQLPEDRWVLMEFYAHWCPACQHFQPDYEKVAAFFGKRGDQAPVVTVARLDCADFGAMCTQFKVSGYPTMKLGLAADLAATALDKLTDVRPASRNFEGVVAFLEKHLDVKFDRAAANDIEAKTGAATTTTGGGNASGAAVELHQHVAAAGGAGAASGGGVGEQAAAVVAGRMPAVADLNDIEGATVKSWEYITGSPVLLKGPDARQALKDWVDLLADNHPVARCRSGAEQLQEALDELWPDDQDIPTTDGLRGLDICPGSDFKNWAGCRSSVPDRRGYTCGLWQLFHTLASRLPESENSGAVWLAAIKGYIGNYFQCSECAKHFMRHAGGEEAIAVSSKRDAVLWMWRTHNIVNRRLGGEERADPSKGDPASPHVQFPPRALCSKCRKAEAVGGAQEEAVPWDEDAVYSFLLSYYSGEQPAAAAAATLRSERSSWLDAGLLVGLVCACVYGTLRSSGQYALKKSTSRIL